ncbi:MAG: dihydroxy-acid dehydratase [Desulfitibacter sp. BRH_c19]|nr:MAG: dihydroxy-acid dehydratase [Desulfitibacter sp. BRH_c19]
MELKSQELRKKGWEIDPLRLAMDWTEDDLDKPQILIESTFGHSHPGSFHLDKLVDYASTGILESGGKPSVFYVTDICDGIAQGHDGMNYSLLSRELIAGMVEVHVKSNVVDACIFISSCDKSVPAHLMAAARLDRSIIHIPGGTMTAGPDNLTLEQTATYGALKEQNKISEKEYKYYQKEACPTCGACQFMGTASTMQVMSEALGLALPGTALMPVALNAQKYAVRQAARQIMSLLEGKITTRMILTEKAFYNALMIHAAIGGSTNALLHMPAIAKEAGISIKPETFNEINQKIPYIVNVRPSGQHATEYFWYAGGVPAVMLALRDYLYLDVLTVTGKTVGENLEMIEETGFIEKNNAYLRKYCLKPEDIIRPIENPINAKGSVAILTGNLAPEGSVVKHIAIAAEMKKHRGPARPFDSEEAAQEAIRTGSIKPGDVLIIRYEGPQGAGMPEMFYTTEALASDEKLVSTTALITDGRFSGATRGPAIGHVSPEALAGGPIALVEENDIIEIDIENNSLNIVGVSGQIKTLKEIEVILSDRKAKWQPPDIKHTGILDVFRKLAASPMNGAYFDTNK